MDFNTEQAKINVIQQYFKNNFSYTEIINILEKFHVFGINSVTLTSHSEKNWP